MFLQELEDVRSSNKQAVHEKLIAVARAKELMRQEQQVEVDRIREQLKNVILLNNVYYYIHPKYIDRQDFAISVDPDQMPLNVASDQALHCLPHIQQFFRYQQVVK